MALVGSSLLPSRADITSTGESKERWRRPLGAEELSLSHSVPSTASLVASQARWTGAGSALSIAFDPTVHARPQKGAATRSEPGTLRLHLVGTIEVQGGSPFPAPACEMNAQGR